MTFIVLQSHPKQSYAVLQPTEDNGLRKGVAMHRMALSVSGLGLHVLVKKKETLKCVCKGSTVAARRHHVN